MCVAVAIFNKEIGDYKVGIMYEVLYEDYDKGLLYVKLPDTKGNQCASIPKDNDFAEFKTVREWEFKEQQNKIKRGIKKKQKQDDKNMVLIAQYLLNKYGLNKDDVLKEVGSEKTNSN